MRLDFTTIKEVFESQDTNDFQVGSSFEKNAISFRFGYWQKADVKKTHGSNLKIKRITNKKKFTSINIALLQTIRWYEKNWRLFN